MEHNLSDKIDQKKTVKRGIIYLSTVPPYMNVLRIREFFENFGQVGRVFLQPAETDDSLNTQQPVKKKRKKFSKHFTEGWVEFEKKSIAKKVADQLNNKQVSSRKNSKQYDCLWNIKYLSNFKWIHLNERLAYEKAVRRQKLRVEIAQVKKQSTIFNLNLGKGSKLKTTNSLNVIHKYKDGLLKNDECKDDRSVFVKNLFS